MTQQNKQKKSSNKSELESALTKNTVEDEYFLSEKTPMRLSVAEKLCAILSCGRKKNRRQVLVETAYEKIVSKLDIFFIINKLIEFDKLKLLLLEENQLKLLDFIPKPIINEMKGSNEPNDTFQNLWSQFFERDLSRAEKAKLAKKAYYELANKDNPSSIDVKLRALIQENFKFLAMNNNRKMMANKLPTSITVNLSALGEPVSIAKL